MSKRTNRTNASAIVVGKSRSQNDFTRGQQMFTSIRKLLLCLIQTVYPAKAGAHDEVIVTVVWVLLPVTEIPRKPVVAHTRQNLSSSALILDPHTTSCEQIQLFIVAQPIFLRLQHPR